MFLHLEETLEWIALNDGQWHCIDRRSGCEMRGGNDISIIVYVATHSRITWHAINKSIHPSTWFLTKKSKLYNRKKKAFSKNSAGLTGCQHVEKANRLISITLHKNKSKWIKDINIKLVPLNLIQESWESPWTHWHRRLLPEKNTNCSGAKIEN